MQAYTGFAEVYDTFMNNVPYDKWEKALADLLAEYGVTKGLVLELGCGTGILTERMAARGYDMIGVDLSEDMLSEAMEKRCESGHNILYLQQDMRSFELYGTVAAVYCLCDSLNYITEREELVQVFRLVNNYLDPGGIFIFDCNTPAEYRSPLRKAPIVEEQDGILMIWENAFDEETRINDHRLTFFLPEEMEPEPEWLEEYGQIRQTDAESCGGEILYRRVEEAHRQRAYTPEEIREVLEEAGMICEAIYEAATHHEPEADCPRIYGIAREKGKDSHE